MIYDRKLKAYPLKLNKDGVYTTTKLQDIHYFVTETWWQWILLIAVMTSLNYIYL
jgi:hypothetical protein